ncbi:MAG: hypothetical protein ACTSX4_06495 [Candidatus Helarchaeota archaeon]
MDTDVCWCFSYNHNQTSHRRFIGFKNGLDTEILFWPLEKKEPNALTFITEKKIDLVINIPKNVERDELDNDYLIRRKSVDFNVPLITNLQLAKRFVEAMYRTRVADLKIKSWREYI